MLRSQSRRGGHYETMARADDTDAGGGETATTAPPRNLEAIGAMVAAMVFFNFGDATMKLVADTVPTGEAVFLRCLGAVILLAVAATATGAFTTLHRAFVPLMAWRSAGDVGSALTFQAALARMPFADITGILQLTPMSLTAASALFLGAPVGWRRWSAVGAGLLGALLVIKPASSSFNPWALVVVLSVAAATLRDLSTRQMDHSISPLVILMLSQAAVAVVALGGLFIETWVGLTPVLVAKIAAAATFTMLGHLLVIHSLRIGDIATVAPFRYSGIVFAILIGFALWGELPDGLSVAGIAVLIAAGLYTFHRERTVARLIRQTTEATPARPK